MWEKPVIAWLSAFVRVGIKYGTQWKIRRHFNNTLLATVFFFFFFSLFRLITCLEHSERTDIGMYDTIFLCLCAVMMRPDVQPRRNEVGCRNDDDDKWPLESLFPLFVLKKEIEKKNNVYLSYPHCFSSLNGTWEIHLKDYTYLRRKGPHRTEEETIRKKCVYIAEAAV